MSEREKVLRLLLFICFGSALAGVGASIAFHERWSLLFAVGMFALGLIFTVAELLVDD